jgi:hypothetical protein
MGMTLTRDMILEAADLKREPVNVPEWGGDVYVSSFTGTERDAFEAKLAEGKGAMKNIRALLVAYCAVDEHGNRIFQDKDAEVLGRKSAIALNRVFEVAMRLNGIGAKEVSDMEKNSEPETSDVSISD